MLKHIGSNWTLSGLQLVAMMWLTPFILNELGSGPNGVWVTIVSMTGFLSLFVMGVPMSTVKHIAEHVARGDTEKANGAIGTSAGISLCLAGCALAISVPLYFAFERGLLASESWSLDAATLDQARVAWWIITAQICSAFVMRLPLAIFDAHQDFVTRNMLLGSSLALRVVLVFVLLSRDPNISTLAWCLVGVQLFEWVGALFLIRRRHAGIRFSVRTFDRTMVRGIVGFSFFATLVNVGTMLAFRSNAMIIGAFGSADDVTDFDIGNKFFEPLVGVMIAVASVVLPTSTRLDTQGRRSELSGVFLKWSKVCVSIALLVGTYLLVLGPRFLVVWIEPRYEVDRIEASGLVLRVLMASFLFYLPIRGVAIPILLGLGEAKRPALGLLTMGLVNIGLSIYLVRDYGILGVACGTAIPNVLYALWVLREACRVLGVSIGAWCAHSLARTVPAALLPAAGLWLLLERRPPEDLIEMGLAAVASTVLFGLLWIGFVYRGDPDFARGASSEDDED
jgi:O-antigen/teichoic acid export membrane protein